MKSSSQMHSMHGVLCQPIFTSEIYNTKTPYLRGFQLSLSEQAALLCYSYSPLMTSDAFDLSYNYVFLRLEGMETHCIAQLPVLASHKIHVSTTIKITNRKSSVTRSHNTKTSKLESLEFVSSCFIFLVQSILMHKASGRSR